MSLNEIHKPKTVWGKLGVGIKGIRTAFRTEPTLWLQVIIGTIAAIFALLVGGQWWYVKQTIFLTVGVVLAELINTSFEYLCDLVEPNKSKKVKRIKDILAGVVLIMACTAIFITVLDFVNIVTIKKM